MSSQTSTGLLATTSFFDKERGKTFVVQYPSFDLMMSDSFLSLRADRDKLSQNALVRLKCLLILLSLPEVALEETAENLEDIADFYADRFPQVSLPNTSASTIKGALKSARVRPPIVLEP